MNSTLERQSHQLEQAAMIRDGIELVLSGPKLFWLVTVLSSKQQVLFFDTKSIAKLLINTKILWSEFEMQVLCNEKSIQL